MLRVILLELWLTIGYIALHVYIIMEIVVSHMCNVIYSILVNIIFIITFIVAFHNKLQTLHTYKEIAWNFKCFNSFSSFLFNLHILK